MSKVRCQGFTRHHWNEREYCVRCGKRRNPAAKNRFIPVHQKPIILKQVTEEDLLPFMK